MGVEVGGRGRFWWTDKREEIGEERGPLFDIGSEEE
jgi:hypothetical protein